MSVMSLAGITRFAHLWLPGYLDNRIRQWGQAPPKRVWFTLADHFEPWCRGADLALARNRVLAWRNRWPEIAGRHRDSAGFSPKYTFFYAEEEYTPEFVDRLAEMTEMGIADVEVHLHHDGEGERNFVDRISGFTEVLHRRHGLLRQNDGQLNFGFIHGNWSLDNSGPHCGLNNELLLLKQLGCYADFTFPAVPHSAQPRLVNTIYWATDDPRLPKSYDTGVPVAKGDDFVGDLLMIPGPLAINWHGDRLMPRIETGELAAHYPVTARRVNLWLESAPRIGSDVFIKLYSHGGREDNAAALLGRDLDLALSILQSACREHQAELRFVSAWEMRQAIAAVCAAPHPIPVEETV